MVSKRDLPFFVLFLILFLLVFREFFFTNRVFYERDSTVIEIPVKKLTVQLLKEGNFALWSDAHGNGQPFLANPKNALLYPSTWLYFFLPLFTAFKLHYLIHALLGWLGLFVLCKSCGLSRKAAFLGASVFAFSGMYLSSFEFYNHIAALCWMPWILLLLNREPGSGRSRFIPLSILWALMILAGAPEFILMTLLLIAGQALMRPGEWRKVAIRAGLPLLLACLIAAAQLLPSFELLGQTERGRQSSAQWPLELIQLFEMPFPHFLGNDRQPGHDDFWGWHIFDNKFPLYYSLYMGMGALLLFLLALRRPLDRKRTVLLISFFVFFLLSCGRYSPFFFVYRFVPLLSSIRYPVKFFLGSVFCLSILAAMGLEDVSGGGRPGKRGLRALVLSAAVGSLLYWAFKPYILSILNRLFVIDQETSLREFGLSIETGLLLLTAYAAAFLLLSRAKGRARFLGWALIALAILDPAYHNRYVNPTVPASFHDKSPFLGELARPLVVYRDEIYSPYLKQTVGDNIRLLGYFRQSLYPFTAMGDGVRYVFNMDFYGTYPAGQVELMQAVKKLPAPTQLKVLKYLGCAAYIGLSPMFSNGTPHKVPVNGIDVLVEPITETRASPYAAFRNVRAAATGEKLALFTEDTFDPLTKVITETDVALGEVPADMEAPPVVTHSEIQGRGLYTVDLPAPAIAVFPGNYTRGWRARIDGRKAEIFEANLFAKGIVVPAGSHQIELRYLPASFLWGAAISLITIFLMASYGAVRGVRGLRRRGRPALP